MLQQSHKILAPPFKKTFLLFSLFCYLFYYLLLIVYCVKLGKVVHTYNPSTEEAETGGAQVQGQPKRTFKKKDYCLFLFGCFSSSLTIV
jgi:hypothetical protein